MKILKSKTKLSKSISPNKIKGCVWGSICGDAIGVPVEFKPRSYLQKHPIKGMTGTNDPTSVYKLTPGTISDDSSMSLVTMESLLKGYNQKDIMRLFSIWFTKAYMTSHDEVFDIGVTTKRAINNYIKKKSQPWGISTELANGNGSLMRIHPIAIYFVNKSDDELINKAFEVSELTHAHIRSKLACAYFCVLLKQILHKKSFIESYKYTNEVMKDLIIKRGEYKPFERILTGKIIKESINKIRSGGYVIDTLEASLWCTYNTKTFKASLLKAVSLGEDTDTVSAVTGAITGALYGYQEIPKEWVNTIVRKDMIEKLVNRFVRRTSR